MPLLHVPFLWVDANEVRKLEDADQAVSKLFTDVTSRGLDGA